MNLILSITFVLGVIFGHGGSLFYNIKLKYVLFYIILFLHDKISIYLY